MADRSGMLRYRSRATSGRARGASGSRDVFSRPSYPSATASRAVRLQVCPVTPRPRRCASSTAARAISRAGFCVRMIPSTR